MADVAMHLVLITPENDRPDEAALLEAFFESGLARLHVRKPHATLGELAAWIERVPARWRPRLIVHQWHELVERFGLGGRHWRDDLASDSGVRSSPSEWPHGPGRFTSRSAHDLAALRPALGHFDSVFFGPVFASLSKPGYGPRDAQIGEALGAVLSTRSAFERRTAVIALGGITAASAPRALALGFEGVAVLGAVWQSNDPIGAFRDIQRSLATVKLRQVASR